VTGSLEDWCAAVERIEREQGPVNGAALVAGAWRGGACLHDAASVEHWRAMLDANLESARVALAALLPSMVARGAGSIVLVGSRAVERPWENAGAAAYTAAKSAAVALVQTVAAEVLARGVRANVVLPSTIDTPANRGAMPNADASRWVSPDSLAAVIAFLLSDAARDVSGAAIPVYGRA
jgi:NAD(P)-dependent dehydrogenase (short-subunit alcohol dehydrogenase family)